MKRAYYSLLKYCADPARGENVNVGVLAVGAHGYGLRLLDRFSHVKAAQPDFAPGVLEAHRVAVHRFFRSRPFYISQPDGHKIPSTRISREVLAEFAARCAGPILSYGPILRVEGDIDSNFSLQSLLHDLYESFVLPLPLARSEERKRKERVKTILRNEFDACDFFNPDKYRHPMQIDEPVELRARGYRLPLSFSFDNGTLHAFEPIDALEHEGLTQLREVALVAMIFQKLREEFGNRVRTYACLVRPPGSPQIRELRILREHARIIDLSRRDIKEDFFLRLHRRLRPRDAEFLIR